LIILQNFEYIYWPDEGTNTFPAWTTQIGSQLKMNGNATLNLSGVVNGRSIELPAGWSYLPVLSFCDEAASDLFAEISDKFEFVKEIAGIGIYWPEMGINTLEMLESGKAYLIKLSQPATVTFNGCNPVKKVIRRQTTLIY
jgi:hypothetical protein